MDIDTIKEINKKAIKGSSAKISKDESPLEEIEEDIYEPVGEITQDFRELAKSYPLMFSTLVFAIIVSVAYSLGLVIKPTFILVHQDGEMIVNRNKLGLASVSIAVITVALLNYML
jgi:hypothetical protein